MCLTSDRKATAKLLAKYKPNELVPIYKYVKSGSGGTKLKAPIKSYTYKPGLIEIGLDPKIRREYNQQTKGIHAYLRKASAVESSEGNETLTWVRLYAVADSLFGVAKNGGHAVFGTVILKKSDFDDAISRLANKAAESERAGWVDDV